MMTVKSRTSGQRTFLGGHLFYFERRYTGWSWLFGRYQVLWYGLRWPLRVKRFKSRG